ncbi:MULTISPECIES: type 4a pilus biogenesis protein PilO [Deinococcus]|uniref:Type 4a pilus biogenesis protein PilO n=1 Tax=Deinococcus rufus TaxID=2136097 RepID=A0ABV7Z6Q2_9DEIO|nr:type 4a pilus biogenesis protein PilO [Deinococcus sp. AB2017081]WQE94756.1 type 4a pilus biogenesis protein PilO [Deinococcus sp. AB2017081]
MSTKLSPRNLFLVVLAGCILLIGLWYMLRFQPRQAQITDLGGQLDTLNTQVATLRTSAARLPALRTEVETMRVDREKFLAALPSAANFGPVLDELRVTTAATGARMNNFSVQTGTVANLPGGVRPLNLTVGITGKFSQVFQTLRAIETMGRFTTVSNVSLQLPTATSFDPDLEGSLGMTVYTFDPAQAAAQAGATPDAPAAPSAPPASGGTQ